MTETVAGHELTLYRLECLAAVGTLEGEQEQVSGLDILEIVSEFLDDNGYHGRLYPNLDWLVDQGLLEKTPVDGRTKNYSLTGEGIAELRVFAQRYLKASEGPDEGPGR